MIDDIDEDSVLAAVSDLEISARRFTSKLKEVFLLLEPLKPLAIVHKTHPLIQEIEQIDELLLAIKDVVLVSRINLERYKGLDD